MRDPAGVVSAAVVEAFRELARVAAVGVHDPDRRGVAGPGAAEDDLPPVRRIALPEVPDRLAGPGEPRDRAVARVDLADFGAAARELGFVVAVEMVRVRALRLELLGDFGTGKAV